MDIINIPAIDKFEHVLGRSVELNLNLNDLRLIVTCFNAVAYWAEVDEKTYLDSDGWKLKERLEGLYYDELCNFFPLGNEETSPCNGERKPNGGAA
jgi:hypothetical protein